MRVSLAAIAILTQLLPIIPFTFLTLTGRRFKWGPYVSIAAMFGSLALSLLMIVLVAGGARADVSVRWFTIGDIDVTLGVLVDPLACVMVFVASVVSFLCQIYSLGYLRGDERLNWFYAAFSLFTASMMALTLANNYVQVLIGWELVGLCSYLLIGFWFERDYVPPAATKAIVVTRLADFPFLLGIILLFVYFGSFEFAPIFEKADTLPTSTITIISLLLFVGAVGKSAQFPLHTWLPDAMAGPSPVSALIHAATMVAAGVYLVARSLPLFELSSTAMLTVGLVGGFTAMIAGLIALAQFDIKRIIAYSTMSQLGYMMAALGVGSLPGAMFHLLTHGMFKALLFLSAGSVIHSAHTMDIREIGQVGGFPSKMKITFYTFMIGLLALAGIPPLAGFWSKDEILLATFEKGFLPFNEPALIFGMLSLTVFLTAFYMSRLAFIALFGPGGEKLHESPKVMTIPLLVLAFFAITIGFVGSPFTNHFFTTFLMGPGHEAEPINMLIAGGSVALAVAGIFLAWAFYRAQAIPFTPFSALAPIRKLAANKFFIDELYHQAFVRTTFGLAKLGLLFDLRIVDGAVNGLGVMTQWLGSRLRNIQTGYVQNYAVVMFFALALIALFLR